MELNILAYNERIQRPSQSHNNSSLVGVTCQAYVLFMTHERSRCSTLPCCMQQFRCQRPFEKLQGKGRSIYYTWKMQQSILINQPTILGLKHIYSPQKNEEQVS